jgi:riboflavin synthase
MFTGLVEAMGSLAARRGSASGPGAILELGCSLGPLELGESISVDGACLTVKRITGGGFEADVSAETLERTTLGSVAVGGKVNLERSLPLGARMGGHLVTGHVDGTCTLTARRPVGDATAMTFSIPAPHARLARLIAEKGSVAINGVSLTVNAVRDVSPPELDVVIVPHTRDVTSLGELAVGSRANLEVDLMARYVARILGAPREAGAAAAAETESTDAAWMERLTRGGYV